MANSYISLLKTAWVYARKERRRYVLVYLMFVLSNLTDSAQPILLGWFIDRIQKDNLHILYNAFLYVGLFATFKLLEWCFHGPARIMERKLAFNLSRNFLQEKYHQALHLPVKWHQDHHSGASINRIRKAYEALKAFFDGGFMYLSAILRFFISFIAMVYFSPFFGSIGLLLGLVIIWVIFRFDKPIIRTQEEINENEHLISATLFDSLSNIMTVITLRLEKSMENGLLARLQSLFSPFRRNAVINEWKWFTADMLIALTYGVITVGYVYQHWESGKVFYVGGLVILLGYVNQFTSVFHDVAWQYNQIIQYNTDVRTASGIEQEFMANHRPDKDSTLPENWNRIDISHLNYDHRESKTGTLRVQGIADIQIGLRRGKRIAIIGESGSGKTTTLALLRGLYEPDPGVECRVDGKLHAFGSLNETVTLLPQEPEIFENTIAYNITLGLPFPEGVIREVCRDAHFAEIVDQLPRGLDSNIQEKGVNLSGGQKQRLALARGILAARESQVILLDEPTSSVDPKTEAAIYEKLFVSFADKAIVSTLHRLHMLSRFDYIYVMHHGSIAEEGSFDDLLLSGKVFRELWKHQEDIHKKPRG